MMPDPVLAPASPVLLERPGGRPERQGVVAVRDGNLVELIDRAIRQEQAHALKPVFVIVSDDDDGHCDSIVDRLGSVHRVLKLAT